MDGSVEAFVAENVRVMTEPFTCDAATLDAIDPSKRASVRLDCC